MEDLPLGRIAALVPEFAVKALMMNSNGKALGGYGLHGLGSISGRDFASVQAGPWDPLSLL